MNSQLSFDPIVLPEAVVLSSNYAKKFKITVQEGEMVFVVALKPRQAYEIEVDDEEMREQTTDPGGILSLQLKRSSLSISLSGMTHPIRRASLMRFPDNRTWNGKQENHSWTG